MVPFNRNDIEILYRSIGGIELYILGCSSSVYDTEKLGKYYACKGEDAIIIGTCSVIELEEKFSQWLASVIKLLYVDKKVYVLGCDVCNNRDAYIGYNGIYDVNEVLDKTKGIYSAGFKDSRNKIIIKIEDGCCYKCSYCIINQIRANPIYIKPYKDICKEIEECIKNYEGKIDIYLTGTEVGIYRDKEYKYDLVDLIDNIYKTFSSKINKISIYSIDPGLPVCRKLIKYIGLHKDYCLSHINMSVQYADDNILKVMGRRHTVKDLYDIHALANEYGVTLGWEIMVGFPGETEETFDNTLSVMKDLRPLRNSLFIYSKRKGTVAYDLKEQVSENIKRNRFNRLSLINDEIRKTYSEEITSISDSYGEGYDKNIKDVSRIQYDIEDSERLKKIDITSIEGYVRDIQTIKDSDILYFTHDERYEYELLFGIVFLRLKYNNDIWINTKENVEIIDSLYKLSSNEIIDKKRNIIIMKPI